MNTIYTVIKVTINRTILFFDKNEASEHKFSALNFSLSLTLKKECSRVAVDYEKSWTFF